MAAKQPVALYLERELLNHVDAWRTAEAKGKTPPSRNNLLRRAVIEYTRYQEYKNQILNHR